MGFKVRVAHRPGGNSRSEPDEHKCAFCGGATNVPYEKYPNAVCQNCDQRATNSDGTAAKHADEKLFEKTGVLSIGSDWGDNPVYIDGVRCWRRYRFGGWITIRDTRGCDSYDEFFNWLVEWVQPKQGHVPRRHGRAQVPEGTGVHKAPQSTAASQRREASATDTQSTSPRFIGQPDGGERSADNPEPRLTKASILAVVSKHEEIEEEFGIAGIEPRAVEVDLDRAFSVDAGPSAPGWTTFEVHIPWRAGESEGVIYAEVEARLWRGEVLSEVQLLRVT